MGSPSLRALLRRPGSYPLIAAHRAAGQLPELPVTLSDHIGDVYRRVEIAACDDFPGVEALRLAALVHEEPLASLPAVLASDELSDLTPTVLAVIGGFGRLWKLSTIAERRRFVEAHRPHLASILLFEVAHEGRATPEMEHVALVAGLDTMERWTARLARAAETLEQRIQRVVREEVAIVAYDPAWPDAFRREQAHLLSCLPADLVRRVEHFGSTAVPGLAAKPIVDVLVEVTDLEATKTRIAPVLEAQGYDYFWRPTHGDDGPPFYAWFIKRDARTGVRTHHVHMVEADFTEHWDRLLFRDWLIAHPALAREYETLKRRLASTSANDRVAYTEGKTEFVVRVTAEAKRHAGSGA